MQPIDNILKDGYTTDDITYRWKNTEPVQIAQGLNLPRFSVEKYASRYCNVKTNTGKCNNHVCIRLTFIVMNIRTHVFSYYS